MTSARAHRALDLISDLLRGFVLPDAHDLPPSHGQPAVSIGVPITIALDLGRPVSTVGTSSSAVFWASVPIAPVDEDGYLGTRKHQIRSSVQVRQWAGVHSVAESSSVDRPTDSDLGCRVSSTVSLHGGADGWGRRPRLIPGHDYKTVIQSSIRLATLNW